MDKKDCYKLGYNEGYKKAIEEIMQGLKGEMDDNNKSLLHIYIMGKRDGFTCGYKLRKEEEDKA